jgi:hypothetical protein
MNRNIKKFIVIFWPYIITIAIIVLPWFLKPGYLFLTDTVWGPIIKLDWHDSYFLLNFIIKNLSFILPVAFLEKIFITGVLFLILFGGKKMVEAVLRNPHFPPVRQVGYQLKNEGDMEGEFSRGLFFILSLFVLFNPFVYDRALYGQFGILAAYGFLLFTVAYLIEVYKTLDFKKIYLIALMSFLTLMFSLHFIFFLAPFFVLFLIGMVLKRKIINWRKLFFFFFLSSLLVLIINANWIFAIISGALSTASFVQKGISQQDLVAFQTSGNGAAGTFGNVFLMSGFWGKDQYRYLDFTKTSGWQKSFIFLSPIIFYGVYLSFRRGSRRNKILTAGLLIIFLLAVILAVGIKAPGARELTLFLYNHFPLYKGLREPQKWVAAIIPIYLIFLSIGAAKIKEWKFINKNIGWSALVLIVIIIMQAPSLLWGFNRQVRPTPYPADWQEVDNFLLNNSAQSYSCSDKIIFLPWHAYMSFNWLGEIVANPATKFFSCPVITGTNMEWGGIYDNSGDPAGQKIEKWIADEGKINNMDYRYVILAKEVDWKNYAWLNNLAYLKLVKTTASLFVYERKN